MTTVGLSISNCTHSYGPRRALEGVSLSVSGGQVGGLVGANGAGKTTLLHAIAGLLKLDSGEISFDGESLALPATRSHMAFVPDDLPRPKQLTIEELSELSSILYGRHFDADRFSGLARRYQLEGRTRSKLGSLSHGMARKADLIAAMLVQPRLLVLDEPFSGLDPTMVYALAEDIEAMRLAGCSVFLSTHDLELAANVCDVIFVLSAGRVVASGSPAELLDRAGEDSMRSAYWALTRENAETVTS